MSTFSKFGVLAHAAGLAKEAYDWGTIAVEATDPATRDEAMLNAATKIAEIAAIDIPIWFLDKIVTKTGLDRVFDSLKTNQSFQQYLQNQAAAKNLRDLSLATIADWGLNELRAWISRNAALDPLFNQLVNSGITWFRPSDPLILDLDNDGIELSTSSSAALFDHNADGLKTGTQWAKADDGILVRDLNGNGTIDSGRELFGDQTQITTINALGQSVTTLASNGFVALRALDADANGGADGIFNASDVAYSGLKLWRDLNQDGISQSNELQTLAESGVTAIQLTQTPTQVTQGKSTFTLTVAGVDANGEPVSTSSTQTAQNVNFTQNTFYREFSDAPAITAEAAALPQMQGTGQVRDLRGAMSLVDSNGQATAPATTLQLSLQAFQTANTAKERQTQVASVIDAWANTSSLGDTKARNPASTQPRGFLQRRQKRVTRAAGCKRGLGRRANQRCGMNYLYCYQ